MMLNSVSKKLVSNIENGEGNSPFLFVGQNLELVNKQVEELALALLKENNIPKVSLFRLEDTQQKIKIEQIKTFLQIAGKTTPYKFQIFLIENIGNMTTSAANSCLKLFEEPDIKNIIFLTNSGEAGVLDTILSRVQIVDLGGVSLETKNDFYYSMIDKAFAGEIEIVSYFFRNKFEKEEYVNFLKTLILYFKDKLIFIEYLEELQEDIFLIESNNVNPRGVVDKWILRIIS